MKIRRVEQNNQKKAFQVTTYSGQTFSFPYAKADPQPSSDDQVHELYVDKELGKEAFTYVLESGDEGSVHIDHVLEYNEDPKHLSNLLLYRLTLEAQKHVEASLLSKREIMRRLRTSPAQFYRLLDQTNYQKSIKQLVSILHVLGWNVDFTVKGKSSE